MSDYNVYQGDSGSAQRNVDDTGKALEWIRTSKEAVKQTGEDVEKLNFGQLEKARETIKEFGENLQKHLQPSKGFWKPRQLWTNGVYKNAGKSRDTHHQDLEKLKKQAESHEKKIRKFKTKINAAEGKIENLEKVGNRLLKAQKEIQGQINRKETEDRSLLNKLFSTPREKLLKKSEKNLSEVTKQLNEANKEKLNIGSEFEEVEKELQTINREAEQVQGEISKLERATGKLGPLFTKITIKYKEVSEEIKYLGNLSNQKTLNSEQSQIVERGLRDLEGQKVLLEGLLKNTESEETFNKVLQELTNESEKTEVDRIDETLQIASGKIKKAIQEIETVVKPSSVVKEAPEASRGRSGSLFGALKKTGANTAEILKPKDQRRATIDSTDSIKAFRKNQVEKHVQDIQVLGEEIHNIKQNLKRGEIRPKEAVQFIKNKIEEIKKLDEDFSTFESPSIHHKRVEKVKEQVKEDFLAVLDLGLSKEAKKFRGKPEISILDRDEILKKFHKKGVSEEQTINQYIDRKSQALSEYFKYVENKSSALSAFGSTKESEKFNKEVGEQLLDTHEINKIFGQLYNRAARDPDDVEIGLKDLQTVQGTLEKAFQFKADYLGAIAKVGVGSNNAQQGISEQLLSIKMKIPQAAKSLVLPEQSREAVSKTEEIIKKLRVQLETAEPQDQQAINQNIKNQETILKGHKQGEINRENDLILWKAENKAFVMAFSRLIDKSSLAEPEMKFFEGLRGLVNADDYNSSLLKLSEESEEVTVKSLESGIETTFSNMAPKSFSFRSYENSFWDKAYSNLKKLGKVDNGIHEKYVENLTVEVAKHQKAVIQMSTQFKHLLVKDEETEIVSIRTDAFITPQEKLNIEAQIKQFNELLEKAKKLDVAEGGEFSKIAERAKTLHITSLEVETKSLEALAKIPVKQ